MYIYHKYDKVCIYIYMYLYIRIVAQKMKFRYSIKSMESFLYMSFIMSASIPTM